MSVDWGELSERLLLSGSICSETFKRVVSVDSKGLSSKLLKLLEFSESSGDEDSFADSEELCEVDAVSSLMLCPSE